MDVTLKTQLHPLANEYLFKYYRTVRRKFSNVLGQMETDYISIALIEPTGQIFFLSSSPGLEQNLIEKNLIEHDKSLQPAFFCQNEPILWSDLYHPLQQQLIYHYKQKNSGLTEGISIPTNYAEYRAVFSFGFKKLNPLLQIQLHNRHEQLLALGKFCLDEIIKAVPLPNQQNTYRFKPLLRLVSNNQVKYENVTG